MALPTITAPAGVPHFLADDHAIDEDSVFAQVATGTGHSRARRVWTVTERVVRVSWLLEADLLALVDAWFEDTLLAGSRQFAARVRNQGAGTTTLWWAARWIDFQTEMLGYGRRPGGPLVQLGRVSGSILLTGEGSETGPETGALGMEVSIALLDVRSTVSVPKPLAMEIVIALEQPTVLRMEVEIALLNVYPIPADSSEERSRLLLGRPSYRGARGFTQTDEAAAAAYLRL